MVSVTTVIIVSQVLCYRKCYHLISSVILPQVLSSYLKMLSYRKCHHLIVSVTTVIILS